MKKYEINFPRLFFRARNLNELAGNVCTRAHFYIFSNVKTINTISFILSEKLLYDHLSSQTIIETHLRVALARVVAR